MLKKNQQIEITIDDLGSEGQGIGRVDGFTVFVEGGLPGEVLEIQIVKLKKNYGYGKLLRIIKPSLHRVAPACSVFEQCGGCSLLHLSYEAQLLYKTNKVVQCLKRIGGFEHINVENTIGMAEPFYYRNKGQFPCGHVDGGIRFGLYSPRSHKLVPVSHCLIQQPTDEKILKAIENFMEENQIKAYDEESHNGLIRHVLIRSAFATGEIMVIIVVNARSFSSEEQLGSMLMEIEGVCSVALNVNMKRTNVIIGKETRILKGKGEITEILGNLKFKISPLSFFQVNPVQTKILYDKVVEFADFQPNDVVIDAYCGIGSIALYVADRVKKVYGVELIAEAIDDAVQNAELNGIENAEFFAGAVEEIIPKLIDEKGSEPDVIILDPPRKGCDEALLRTILEVKPEKVIYVSCNPSTLARDLKILCATEGEYEIKKVQPVDCFCHGWHVETVVLLVNLNSMRGK